MLFQQKSTSEHWEFVCDAVDAAGDEIRILRNSTCDQRAFSRKLFPPNAAADFVFLASGVALDSSDAIKEALQGARHTSAIRFVAMPVYFAVFGALANAWLEGKRQPIGEWDLVSIAGLLVASVFVVFDIVLSRNLIRVWAAVQSLTNSEPWKIVWAHRQGRDRFDLTQWTVRLFLFLPYLGGLGYWLLQVFGTYSPWIAAVVSGIVLVVACIVWARAKA